MRYLDSCVEPTRSVVRSGGSSGQTSRFSEHGSQCDRVDAHVRRRWLSWRPLYGRIRSLGCTIRCGVTMCGKDIRAGTRAAQYQRDQLRLSAPRVYAVRRRPPRQIRKSIDGGSFADAGWNRSDPRNRKPTDPHRPPAGGDGHCAGVVRSLSAGAHLACLGCLRACRLVREGAACPPATGGRRCSGALTCRSGWTGGSASRRRFAAC